MHAAYSALPACTGRLITLCQGEEIWVLKNYNSRHRGLRPQWSDRVHKYCFIPGNGNVAGCAISCAVHLRTSHGPSLCCHGDIDTFCVSSQLTLDTCIFPPLHPLATIEASAVARHYCPPGACIKAIRSLHLGTLLPQNGKK